MNSSLQLNDVELHAVQEILAQHFPPGAQKIWVFGSRANGRPRADSDLDLLFDPPLPLVTRAKLSEAFEESSLSFEVDLVNREDLAPEYRDRIEAAKIALAWPQNENPRSG